MIGGDGRTREIASDGWAHATCLRLAKPLPVRRNVLNGKHLPTPARAVYFSLAARGVGKDRREQAGLLVGSE
jgi:hypothetical protein